MVWDTLQFIIWINIFQMYSWKKHTISTSKTFLILYARTWNSTIIMKNLKTYHVITIKNIKLSFYAVLCFPVFCRILTFLSTKFIMKQLLLPRQQTKLLIKTALWVAKITINKLLQIEIKCKVTRVQSIYK